MKISELQRKTKTITVEYQGETVNLEYRLNAVTPAFLDEGGDAAAQLVKLVTRWDIVDDDGSELAPEAVVRVLPVELLAKILSEIVADMRLDAAEKKG